MFSEFRSLDLGNGYTILEPSAGLIPEINKRLKSYTDDSGNMTANVWAAVFVLACLHKDGVPVISGILEGCSPTVREAYSKLSDLEFKAIVEEFLFNINRDTLEKWFDAVDKSCFITKKTADELKNA